MLYRAVVICNMAPPAKKNKKLSLDQKVKIIKMKKEGKRNCDIAREFEVGESTVRMVYKNKEQIENAAKTYGGQMFDSRSHCTNTVIIQMERYLAHYINRKEKEGVPLEGRHIKDQAKVFYATCLQKARNNPPKKPFKASNGWLTNFLKRKGFKNIKFSGERGSADTEAAASFPNVLKKIIEEGGYTKDQIFNLDESGLNWKKMPRSTYIAKHQKQARGRKVDKSRFTVMFTVNLSGSLKMKPVIVHTAKHPRCYNNVRSMESFSNEFYWYGSPKGWMNSAIMKQWILDHFVPDCRLMCRQLGIPFKALILMDNAACHPPYLCDVHPNVKIVFLPPNTTSLVQPLDQEIIACVKNFYHTRLFDHLRAKTETNEEIRQIEAEDLYGDLDIDEPLPDNPPEDDLPDPTPDEGPVAPEMNVRQFWRQFTIRNAVDFLIPSWNDINEATVNHAWKYLVPHLVSQEVHNQVQQVADSERAVVAAAQAVAGCQDVTVEEVRELTQEEESAQSAMQRVDEEDQLARERKPGESQAVQVLQGPSMCNLANILFGVDTLKDIIGNNDNDTLRVEEICNSIDNTIRYYADKHRDGVNKRTQSLITKFVRCPAPAQPFNLPADPRPGPSTQDNDAISEVDFEGFLNEAATVVQTQDASSDSESDEGGPGPQ